MTDPKTSAPRAAANPPAAGRPRLGAPGGESGRLRAVLGTAILLAMTASALYSGNVAGVRDRLPPPALTTGAGPGPAVADPGGAGGQPARRSYPWWQPVAVLSADGPDRAAVTIDDHALQWRVRWTCETGAFRLQPVDSDGGAAGHALADAGACPQEGTGFSVQTGPVALRADAAGPWRAVVEQQVDVPLVEPPTPAMQAADTAVVARARLYDVDRRGEGTVTIYRTAAGAFEMRLEDFWVSPDVDLEVRLSELPAPATTAEVAAAPFEQVAFLPATSGAMNLRLPDGVDLDRYASVVIWCQPLRVAYAAATLER